MVGNAVSRSRGLSRSSQFLPWAIGSSLFANAATCISVSYFDQSFLFLYLTLAVIGSMKSFGFDAKRAIVATNQPSSEECFAKQAA